MGQLFIHSEEACDVARRGILHSILIEFGIPVKLIHCLKCV